MFVKALKLRVCLALLIVVEVALLLVFSLNMSSFRNFRINFSPNIKNCDCWNSSYPRNKTKVPMITLDPDKLMYPYPPWGPNNQMGAFMNAVYLSIRLNRSVALIRFGVILKNKLFV